MAADFAVGTKFTASNKMGTVYKSMSKSTNKFAAATEKSFGRASRSASRFGSIVKGIITTDILRRGTMLLQRGMAETTSEFLDFDSAITAASAKFPEKIGRGTAAFVQLENAARQVGATTEFTAAQAAAGLEEYAKAGIDSATAMGLLAGTAELATNANVEFAEAASISLDALDSFNLRSKDSAQTAKNLARVNDTLTKVVTSAKLDFQDFAETLKFAGPVAKATGADLADLATLTGVVAKAGIRGSLAGTTLKNVYLGLAAPVGKGAKTLKKLGITITDSSGNMRDAMDILIDFQAATAKMGNAQRLAAANAVFGKRAIAGVSKILSLGSKDLIEYRDAMQDSTGASADMAKIIRGSLLNKLKVLRSGLIEVGFKIIKAFSGKGAKALDSLIKKVQNFDPQPIVDGLIKFGKFFLEATKTVIKFKDEIIAVGASFAAFKFAGALAAALPAIVSGFAALTSPLGLVALGFAGAAFFAIKFREELKPIATAIQSVVMPAFEDVKTALGDISAMFVKADGAAEPIVGVVADLAAGFLKFTGSLAIGPLRMWAKWASINAKILGFVFRAVSFVVLSIKGFLQPALDTISQRFAVLKKRILDFLSPLKSVTGAIGDFFGQIDTLISDPKEAAKKAQGTEGGGPAAAPLDFRLLAEGPQGFAPADFRQQQMAGLQAPLATGFEPSALDQFDRMSLDELTGENFRFAQPELLPGVDTDTDKLINGISDAIKSTKEDTNVNVTVNSPIAGTTATATVTKAPSVNNSQLGKTS